jgi:hypothetical protein
MSRARRLQALACVACGTLTAVSALAQEAEKSADAQTQAEARKSVADVINTTAPAFAALGVSGQTITDPEGLKTAAFSLINGTDADGKPLSGVGVQFSPAQLFGRGIQYQDYKKKYSSRAIARFQVTGAYARADGDNGLKPQRAAIGAIWVPYDETDPFDNPMLDQCLEKAFLVNPSQAPAAPPTTPTGSSSNPERKAAFAACRERFVRTPTNGISSQIGFAKLFRSRDGGKGPLVGAGFAASAVVSIGLDGLFKQSNDAEVAGRSHIGGKLVLGAVIRERELVANPLDATKFIDRNRQSYGAKLLVGNARAWWFGVEFLHQRASYQGLGSDLYTTYNACLDVNVAQGIWIAANYGDSWGENFGKSSQFTAGLKFSLQPSSSIGGDAK